MAYVYGGGTVSTITGISGDPSFARTSSMQRGVTVQPRQFTREYRLIQTGFMRMWDASGGDLKRGPGTWFNQYKQHDYAFKLPRMEAGGAKIKPGTDINIGRLGANDPDLARAGNRVGGTREDTFRLTPLPPGTWAPGPNDSWASTQGNPAEYGKKLLFTWALMMNATMTTAEFGSELRQYEKPDHTTSGKGQFQGTNKRKARPLPHIKQLTKFFWSRLSSTTPYSLKGKGGGFHHGAGQGDIAADGNRFRDIYEDSISRKYKMSAIGASQRAMRKLLARLGSILTVDPSGKKSLETESAEELIIAIAGNSIHNWNNMSRAQIEADMARMMNIPGQKLRAPHEKIDIPHTNTAAINRIIGGGSATGIISSTGPDAMKTKAAIKAGGLEVTMQPERLRGIYNLKKGFNETRAKYLQRAKETIQEDMYNRYTAGKKHKPSTVNRTVAEQFYDRDVGMSGGQPVLTWSEPAYDGVAFFSVFPMPNGIVPVEPAGVPVHIYFEPSQALAVGELVLVKNGIQRQHIGRVMNAARNSLHGGIRDSTQMNILGNTLGTSSGPLYQSALRNTGLETEITTTVDISAPSDVAAALYDLVQEVADNLGRQISIIAPGTPGSNKFSDWIAEQQQAGEAMGLSVHQSAGRGWRNWLQQLSAQHKKGIDPADAAKWPQPIHPRPFLWMTAAGQAQASKEAHDRPGGAPTPRRASGKWTD